MSNRIYIVLHKKHPTVLQRLAQDSATKSHWFKSPSGAWRDYVTGYTVGPSTPDPSDHIIVGGDVIGDPDGRGAYRVDLDWRDTHEAWAADQEWTADRKLEQIMADGEVSDG